MTQSAKLYRQKTWKRFVSKICSELILICLLVGCGSPRAGATSTLFRSRNGVYRYWAPEDFPVLVRVDGSIDERYIRGMEAAVTHWNARVGLTFLRITVVNHEEFWQADHCINVQERDLGSSDLHRRIWGLNTPQVSSTGRIERSLVEFDEDLPSVVIYEVALHELGHALGLRHDEDNRDSIMHPYVMDHWYQVIQEDDVESVRRYVPDTMPRALINDTGDPFPHRTHVDAPVVHFPPPCPGIRVIRWFDLVTGEEHHGFIRGPCVGP